MEKVRNNGYVCLILIISISLFPTNVFSDEAKPQTDEKTNEYYQTLLQAINLINFSLNRICSTSSISMIKAEYTYILNNIDLDKVNFPEEIKNTYQEIINSLSELKTAKGKLSEGIDLLEREHYLRLDKPSSELVHSLINLQEMNRDTRHSLMNCSKILYYRCLFDNRFYNYESRSYPPDELNEEFRRTVSSVKKEWMKVIKPYFYNQILPKLPDALLVEDRMVQLLLRNFYAKDFGLCLQSFNDMQKTEKGIVQTPIYWLLYAFSASTGKNNEVTEICMDKFLECYESVLKKDIFLEVIYIRKLEHLLQKNPELKDESINQKMLAIAENAYKCVNDKNILYKIYLAAIFYRLNKMEKTQEILSGINPEFVDKENRAEYGFYQLAMYDLNHGYDVFDHMRLLAKILEWEPVNLEQLEEIKEAKIPEVFLYLGRKYIYGKENKDRDKGLAYMEEASELGSEEATSYLAYRYMYGYLPEMKKDEKKGLAYFQKLAEKGDQEALCEIGRCYYMGIAVPQDFNKAKEYFEKSGKDGKYWLGLMYSKGDGVPRDYQKAYECFYDVIRDDLSYGGYQNHYSSYSHEANMAIGDLYFTGKIDVVNYLKAMEYYQKADSLPEAQVKMGYIYENGYEIQKNYSKAKECYEKAEQSGNLDAILRLGDFYLYGLAGKKDYVLSYAHYTLVIRLVNEGSDHPQAKELAQQAEQARKKLLPNIWNFWSGLTPEEIKEAEDIANSWKYGSILTRKNIK